MFRRSSNNVFIPPKGLNSGSFAKIGNSTDELGERYPGLLGATLVVDDGGAKKYSDTSVGTLRNGVYQLVKFSGAVTKGRLVFWDTNANKGFAEFEVTGTSTATSMYKAGVALYDVSANEVTAGAYGWIQVAGLATCNFVASGNNTALGNVVLQNSATTSTVISAADGDAVATALAVKRLVGIAYEAVADVPTTGDLKLVALNLAGFYQNIA